jgi:hypothetical protein
MSELGRALVIAGVVLIIVGAALWAGFGKGWLGQLPGDIRFSRGNLSFHFPIVTCLLASIVLTLIFWFLRR